MVTKMRSKKTLKELLKLDLKTLEAMAPKPFRLTRIDVIVSLQDPEYCKVNLAAMKANKSVYCKEDYAVLERLSKALKLHHSLGKARMKENKGKRTLNKKDATSSPSTESTLAFTSPSTGSTLASTSTTKTDIPELPEMFKAIIASLKGFDVTFVMQRKLTKTDLEPNNSRLAMPEKQINEECKFLAHKDAAIMRVLEARDEKGRLIGMKVGLIEPSGEVCHDQVLKKWNMTSASTYNLASSSWCDIARRNHLKKDHLLNIWCFNDVANKFYFLLHHVGSEPLQ
ncbi:B3 domain-containing protein At2g24670 [Arachis duranensis]|uniref:B3 domain-containing protein At2g24670 n=1 Tax=Arachis duranensis TaxID=130453 RepID=A0A9C6WWT9_ARADU|nr:B3 domain-containing protein At2g24670 [Arachis duranensis]